MMMKYYVQYNVSVAGVRVKGTCYRSDSASFSITTTPDVGGAVDASHVYVIGQSGTRCKIPVTGGNCLEGGVVFSKCGITSQV